MTDWNSPSGGQKHSHARAHVHAPELRSVEICVQKVPQRQSSNDEGFLSHLEASNPLIDATVKQSLLHFNRFHPRIVNGPVLLGQAPLLFHPGFNKKVSKVERDFF